MPPSPSTVWKHFTRTSDKKSGTCNLCGASFAYLGTTSNLLNHMKGKHPTTSASSSSDNAKK